MAGKRFDGLDRPEDEILVYGGPCRCGAAEGVRHCHRYAIEVTTRCWATRDGGADRIGSQVEMEELARLYRASLRSGQDVTFEVKLYTGVDPER